MRSTPSAPSPEARGGRWTLWGAGDAKQPRKRRESARKARAGARETVMAVSEALKLSPAGGITSKQFRPLICPMRLELGADLAEAR